MRSPSRERSYGKIPKISSGIWLVIFLLATSAFSSSV